MILLLIIFFEHLMMIVVFFRKSAVSNPGRTFKFFELHSSNAHLKFFQNSFVFKAMFSARLPSKEFLHK
jgi:hypothetical protein